MSRAARMSPPQGVRFSLPCDETKDDDQQSNAGKHPSSPPPSESSLPELSPTNSGSSSSMGTLLSGMSVLSSKDLRANLTRQQKNRDPMLFYEITAVLGVGSMGSVAKVRKRDSAIGGSARRYNQVRASREAKLEACWSLPLVGGVLRDCFKKQMESILMDSSEYHAAIQMDRSSKHHGGEGTITTSGSDESSDFVYAMKSIHLSRVTDPAFILELRNEIDILKSLDHPHIVRAIETFEDRHQIFVIMELCSGGDLYTRDPYTEEEAARITSCIVNAVRYMHSRNILHRDLKYENILFVNDSLQSEIKLIDFGLSKKFATTEELTEGVGTIYTMAPEVLRGSYTKQADLWSIGVIAYMLMSSQMPFYGRTRKHIVEQIMDGQYEFKGRRWKRISRAGKAFIEDLLVVDPDDRSTAAEASSALWLNRRIEATVRNACEDEINNVKASIMKYTKYSKLQKMALMVIAHKSTCKEIGILRKLFQQYDTEPDGQLSYDEFKVAIKETGLSEEDYRHIFDAIDVDGTGIVRYTEFLAATIEALGVISEERLAEAFDRLDSDDSGYISAENLSEMLGADFPKDEIQSILKEVSKDGKVTYADFLAHWESRKENDREEDFSEVQVGLAPSVSGDISVLSDETDSLMLEDDKDILLARASFIDGKKMSERKVIVSHTPLEFIEGATECKKEID